MAQTNYTPIYLYSSGTTGNSPSAGNLGAGELAINYTDGKLFYKDNANAVQVIGWKTTPTTAGGTGLTSYTAGDLPYYASGSALSKLGIGTSGYVLQSNGSAPTWVAQSTLSVGTATNATNTAITDNTSSSSTWYPTIVSATTGNLPQTTSSTKLSFVPSTGLLNSGKFTSISTFGFKNRIINGAMEIDQRNNGASVTPNFSYTVDRWYVANTQTGKLTAQQNAGSVTPPTGFINYLGLTSTSAYSVGSGDTFYLVQKIEGLNVADLAFGSSGASNVNLSFMVYSSLTGTFGGALQNSASNRSYPFSYTVSSANTWTNITISIPGDTSGTWLTTSGIGIQVIFGLGSGSTFSGTAGSWASGNYNQPSSTVSVVGTNGATFYITGVQFETGNIQTTFDVRDYGRESYLCYRYCETATTPTNYSVLVNASFVNYVSRTIGFQAIKRASPTVTVTVTNYDNASSGNGTIEFVSTQGFNHGQGISLTGFPYNAISIAYLATAEL